MKKLYSFSEFYNILVYGIRTVRFVGKAKKKKEITIELTERIMLAVTEVNQCEMCAYHHTKMALENGLAMEEIKSILCGSKDGISEDELPAILFAQHYADSRCNPSKDAWQKIVKTYGESKANGILGVIRTITIGNAIGIPFGSLKGRLKGKPDKRSSLRYEIVIILCLVIFAPVALIHALLMDLNRQDLI